MLASEFYSQVFPPLMGADDPDRFSIRAIRDAQDVQKPQVKPRDIPATWPTPNKPTQGEVTGS